MKLLAISMSTHDNNATYFDGKTVQYCKFERNKQKKHFAYDNAWEWIKDVEKMWNFKIKEIDEVAIDYDPFVFEKNPIGYDELLQNKKMFYEIPNSSNPFLKYGIKKIIHVNHHYAHAMSTWMIEDKNNNINTRIVIDGIGNDKSFTVFKDNNIIRFGLFFDDSSIGVEMDKAGSWLGIKSQHTLDHAGKVMGLQSYGNIDYDFLEKLKKYKIDDVKKIFDIKKWEQHKNDDLIAKLTPLDWIKTVHEQIGDLLVNFFSEYANENEYISYSGGVAQNVVWNTKLKNKFKNLIIPPHAGDEGTSLGLIEILRIKNNIPKFKINNFPYCQNDYCPETNPTKETIKFAAKCLSEGKIIGWYQGNGEIGPRALGNRSILMDPKIRNGKEIINKVKKRENYRPFGASVLSELCKEYFDTEYEDNYMLFTKKIITNSFPSITHIDGTCRVQTVNKNSGYFRELIEEFYKITGYGIILNTSLNINGKPIAGYPENAIDLFFSSSIDYMFIGNSILSKEIFNK